MPQIQKGILGLLAVGLTLGAVQLASGHDLIGRQTTAAQAAVEPDSIVNRAAKADRIATLPSGARSRTIALKVDGLPDTSVLVSVPAAKEEARNRPVGPGAAQPGEPRKLACEPVVSVLTDVAKLLQPGRCVT